MSDTIMQQCMSALTFEHCNWTANYWWHSPKQNKRQGMCFGHATVMAHKYGGRRDRKQHAH